jgi:hypothetical protein
LGLRELPLSFRPAPRLTLPADLLAPFVGQMGDGLIHDQGVPNRKMARARRPSRGDSHSQFGVVRLADCSDQVSIGSCCIEFPPRHRARKTGISNGSQNRKSRGPSIEWRDLALRLGLTVSWLTWARPPDRGRPACGARHCSRAAPSARPC